MNKNIEEPRKYKPVLRPSAEDVQYHLVKKIVDMEKKFSSLLLELKDKKFGWEKSAKIKENPGTHRVDFEHINFGIKKNLTRNLGEGKKVKDGKNANHDQNVENDKNAENDKNVKNDKNVNHGRKVGNDKNVEHNKNIHNKSIEYGKNISHGRNFGQNLILVNVKSVKNLRKLDSGKKFVLNKNTDAFEKNLGTFKNVQMIENNKYKNFTNNQNPKYENPIKYVNTGGNTIPKEDKKLNHYYKNHNTSHPKNISNYRNRNATHFQYKESSNGQNSKNIEAHLKNVAIMENKGKPVNLTLDKMLNAISKIKDVVNHLGKRNVELCELCSMECVGESCAEHIRERRCSADMLVASKFNFYFLVYTGCFINT